MTTAISFDSDGQQCAGALYRPEGRLGPLPCVVMANGVSGTMDWILPAYAACFAAAGLAVLTFDYRHLGRSAGEPRQLVELERQRADLRAAVAWARAQPDIDAGRIALWGTSLGGSHVIALAAQDRAIRAVVATLPALDAVRGATLGKKRQAAGVSRGAAILATLRLAAAAVSDAVRGRLGLAPRYLQVYGPPGRALFTDPALAERFAAVGRGSPTWRNRIAARFLFELPRYREGTMERIAAPLLVCLAEQEVELSNAYVQARAARAPLGETRLYPGGHFDLYHGELAQRVAREQAEFLARHLLAPPRTFPAEPSA